MVRAEVLAYFTVIDAFESEFTRGHLHLLTYTKMSYTHEQRLHQPQNFTICYCEFVSCVASISSHLADYICIWYLPSPQRHIQRELMTFCTYHVAVKYGRVADRA